MPDWLIWVVAIWFACGIMGRGCSWKPRRRHRLRGGDGGAAGSRRRVSRSRRRAVSGSRSGPEAPEPGETREERIRRRFVEGRIDLDQYEAELWEELRPGE